MQMEAGVTEIGSRVDFAASRPRWNGARLGNGLWTLAGVAAALAFGQAAIAHLPLGPRSAHMAAHIFSMNAAAPALAIVLIARGRESVRAFASGRVLLAAAILQMALLWTWHAPNIVAIGFRQPWTHAFMQASLLAASLGFWLAVLSEAGPPRWRAVAAILLTGKIFCLLGALLLFAPRLLYADAAFAHGSSGLGAPLADQQFAGLMMLAACPLCYAAAGIAIAARWLRDLESIDARRPMRVNVPALRE